MICDELSYTQTFLPLYINQLDQIDDVKYRTLDTKIYMTQGRWNAWLSAV